MKEKATGVTRSYNMKETSSGNRGVPLSGVIKTTLAYGFVGFASLIVLYIIMMIFWTGSMMNILYSVGFVQTCILVLFVQFTAGFFAQIAIYRNYNTNIPEAGGEPGSPLGKFKNYGLLAGLFTGFFIFIFPTIFVLLASHGSSGLLHSLTNIFNNFFPFVISGIIMGAAGSYYAGLVLKKGFSEGEERGRALRKISLNFGLIAILIVFVPLFFSLTAAHLHETEVIAYGQYDERNLTIIKTDENGEIMWTAGPITTTGGTPGPVVAMKNGSYALFGFEPSIHGKLNTLTYISSDGTVSDAVEFLISDGEMVHAVEIPGTGFLLSDYSKNIFSLAYDGNFTGHYSIPEPQKQSGNSVEMVFAGENRTFLSWGEYCAFMDEDGDISYIRTFANKGYTERPYRITVNGAAPAYNGGFIICTRDAESRELKAVWLDGDLNPLREKILGTSHASYISIHSRDSGDIILIEDSVRPENNPSDFEEYFRICDIDSGTFYDITTEGPVYESEVFINSDESYTIFTFYEKSSSGEMEVIMQRCGFDDVCSEPAAILTGGFAGIKVMQTSDGGYLFAYITEEAE